MDKQELKEIIALANIDTIAIALKNRGWRSAETDKVASTMSLVNLFKGRELLSTRSFLKDGVGYQMTIYDDVRGGEQFNWAVLFTDTKLKWGWRPKGIRIFVKDKNFSKAI
ncbi:MAG: hypothetical protein IJY07_04655 [Clostridia bacterium]|nr:hypothetical protein [Clostridia bacterium]